MGKSIAIIPARGGSKRFPQKNITAFGGKPLIAHSIEYAKSQKQIHDVYVSTDDAHIKKVALTYGAKVIDRPPEISGDHEPTITSLQHCLDVLSFKVDHVILLQATNPLRPKTLFTQAYSMYKKLDVDSLFTVSRNFDKLGHIKDNKFIPFNYKPGQRSQDLTPLFFENGLLYITKAHTIKQGIIMSKEAYPFEVSHPYGLIDIDTKEDLEYAKFALKTYTNE